MEYLHDFLIRAKKNTYANGKAARVNSTQLGSKDYHYEEVINGKTYSYHDTYFGSNKFVGEEKVRIDDKVMWSMNYYGYNVEGANVKEAYDLILKPALMLIDNASLPLRGVNAFKNGNYTYSFKSNGDLNCFTGTECIYKDDILIYCLECHGGIIE